MSLTLAKPAHYGVVALLLSVLFLQLAFSIRRQSQTIDEGVHLIAGYRYWQCHDFGINPEHPPLVKFVAAAPLWLRHAPAPAGACGAEPTAKDDGYAVGYNYLYEQDLDADALLLHARLAASFFALLLALSCYWCARRFFGEAAGLAALVLVVFEPTVLAHGALIATDTAVSGLVVAAVLCFYRYSEKRTAWRLLSAGIFTGLALASKHSGVLILPILLVLAGFEFLQARRRERAAGQPSLGKELVRHTTALLAVFLIGVTVLWCTYGLRYNARPAKQPMSTPLSQFITQTQEQRSHGVLLTAIIPGLASAHLLPEAYLYGLVDVLSVMQPGQPPFLLGKLYAHGRWFYFPVAFLIKSTLSFLLLFVLALCVTRWRGANLLRQLVYLAVPSGIILAAAMRSGLNIGYRHVLPIVGFLCILIAGAVVSLCQQNPWWRVVIAGLLVAHVASSLHAFPNYLAYSNEAWGGPSETYRYLTDSNVDWGQGLYQTSDFLARQNVRDCWIAYDGVASVSYYDIPCRQLIANPGADSEVPPTTADGIFILSALTVSGIEWELGDLHPYREFQRARPIANIGGAMLVYRGRFDLTGVAAAAHIGIADNRLGESKPGDALPEAQAAVALTPRSVRAHLSLGRALAGLGRRDAARQELQTTLALAEEAGRAWCPLQIAAARQELRKLDQTRESGRSKEEQK